MKAINLCFLALLLPCALVHADPVEVNVTGRVIAAPCIVDPGTVEQYIDFGQLRSTDFREAGIGGEWKDFSLSVSSCPVTTTRVTSTFSGEPDSDDPGKFANTGTGTGLALQLASRDHGTDYTPQSAMTVDVDKTSHSAEFPLSARVYTPKGNVTPGTFASVVLVTFTYQ